MKHEIQFEGRTRLRHGINLVPLINIVFLLLIFFMLSSTLITPDTFDIELPESNQSERHESVPIVITISHDGAIAVNNVPILYKDLADALKLEVNSSSNRRVMIRADAAAPTADIVAVLRHAKKANIEKIGIATQPGPSP